LAAVLAVTAALQVSALPVALQHGPGPAAGLGLMGIWALASVGLLLVGRSARLARVASHPAWSVLLLVAVAVAVATVYPHADALKHLGRGSDQDDAIIGCVQALLQGRAPYPARTYLGLPVSAGPGALVVHLPFVLAGVYPVAGVAAVVGATLALHRISQGWLAANVFLGLLASSLLFWQQLVVGSDLGTWGCLLVVALLALRPARPVGGHAARIAATALLVLVASARVVFVWVPALAGVLLWRQDRRRALLVAALGTAATVALHLSFAAFAKGAYSPLHLLGRMQGVPWWVSGAAAALVAAALYVTWRFSATSAERWLGLAALSVTVSLAVPAVVDLVLVNRWAATHWRSRFLMPGLPVLAAYAGVLVSSRSQQARKPLNAPRWEPSGGPPGRASSPPGPPGLPGQSTC